MSCQPPATVLQAGSHVLRAHVGDVGVDDSQSNLTSSGKAMKEGKPETLAKVILSQDVVGCKDLRALLDILPSELPHEVDGTSDCSHLNMSKSFQVGSFVHGEVQGVRSAARKFPLATTVICMSSSFSRTCGLARLASSRTSWPSLIRIPVMNIVLTAPLQRFRPSTKEVCGLRTQTGTMN